MLRGTDGSWRRALVVASAVGLFTSWSGVAFGWYFPEHTELTRLALRDFAPAFAAARIQRVVADAAASGLDLCPEATTALHAVPTSGDATRCIPYGALAALAADHSNTVVDLRETLSTPISRPWPASNEMLGALLTAAAQGTWESFQSSAPTDVVRIWTMDVSRLGSGAVRSPSSLSPRDYVRTLDAELFAIDSQYVSRAKNAKTHFHDPTSAIDVTLAQATTGDMDNALAQALAHHARSLQLAAWSRTEPDASIRLARRTEALLEHAFALHFLEDGLAAGHIVTDPAVASDERRAQRHDFFNRQGLAVTRALASVRCDEAPPPEPWSGSGLGLCWVAHGDGFAASEDRLYVGEAVARLQTAFALALEPIDPVTLETQLHSPVCESWVSLHAPKDGCDAAWMTTLLDPLPALTGQSPEGCGTDKGMIECWARSVREKFEGGLAKLGAAPPLLPADAGSARVQPGVLTPEVLGAPLDVVTMKRGKAQGGSAALTYASESPSGIAFLWLPLLAAWPDAQADATTLEGTDSFGRGIKGQILASLAGTYSSPFQDEGSLTGWAGVGTGISYSAQGVFPRRHTRAVFEANVGVAQGVTLAGTAERFHSLGVLELRVPVTTLLLYGVAKTFQSNVPLRILGRDITVGLLGGRAYWLLRGQSPTFNGWDVEVVNFLLDASEKPRAATTEGILDGEGRLRIGFRADDPAEALHSMFGGSFVAGFEVNSGLFF